MCISWSDNQTWTVKMKNSLELHPPRAEQSIICNERVVLTVPDVLASRPAFWGRKLLECRKLQFKVNYYAAREKLETNCTIRLKSPLESFTNLQGEMLLRPTILTIKI